LDIIQKAGRNLKEREKIKDQDGVWRIILNHVKEFEGKEWRGVVWLRIEIGKESPYESLK
jgi:hypothetical protein